jgi:WD40 repeat protein
MTHGAAKKPERAPDRSRSLTEPASLPPPPPDASTDPSRERARPIAFDLSEPRVTPDGRYRLLDEIGRGGIGRVRRARDLRLDRIVALKDVLARAGGVSPRFAREAVLTARLEHPSIVPIHDRGEDEDGRPYYTMRLVEGEPLSHAIASRPTLGGRLELVSHVLALADAIAFAHDRGIIHRDLKPANVLVGKFGETVVVDWGLAKDVREPAGSASAAEDDEPGLALSLAFADTIGRTLADESDNTRAGSTLGTPAYMPPEQFDGLDVDARADVFALGAVLYHVLSGCSPYAGAPLGELVERIRAARPTPLRELEARVPRDLVAIVEKAMSPRREDRYPTAMTFADDLRRFQTGQLVTAYEYGAWALAGRWVHRFRAVLAVAAVALAVLVVVVAASVRRVLHERDAAERSRRAAVTEEEAASRARRIAEQKTRELTYVHARGSLQTDPTAALAWLKTSVPLAVDEHVARATAAEAMGEGVARHVLVAGRGGIKGVAFSPDGARIVAADRFGNGAVFDAATGSVIEPVRVVGGVSSFAFAADGAAVLGGGEGKLVVMDRDSRRETRAHVGEITSLTAVGRWVVTTGFDGNVVRWDPRTLEGKTLAHHALKATHTSAPADGSFVVSVSHDGYVQITSIDGAPRARYRTPSPGLDWAVVSRDGATIATAGANRVVYAYDVATRALRPLGAHDGMLEDVAFAPDGRTIATSSRDLTVRIWSLAGGPPRVLRGHTGSVRRLAFADHGRLLASASYDHTVRVWELATGRSAVLRGHTGPVEWLAVAPDETTLASAADDGTVRVWDLRGVLDPTLGAADSDVYGIAPTADGSEVATGGQGGQVTLWSLAARTHVTLPRLHTNAVWSLASVPGTRAFVTAGQDGIVGYADFDAGTAGAMGHHPTAIEIARVVGRTAVTSGEDGAVGVWDLDRRAQVAALAAHGGRIHDMAIDAAGLRLVTGGADGTGTLWDLPARALLARLEGHARPVTAVAIDARGERVVTGDEGGRVRIWSGSDGALQREIVAHDERVRALAFAPDGRTFVTGSTDRTARVFALDGTPGPVLRGHGHTVSIVFYTPAGDAIVTGGPDGTVRIWDARTGELRSLVRYGAMVSELALSPGGGVLLGGAWDGLFHAQPLATLEGIPSGGDALRAWLGTRTSAEVSGDGIATPVH